MTTERAPDFAGLRVASLESRRAADMQRMIEKYGGQPFVSPSMREVPIEPNREAIDFAYKVITGEISVMILMTAVGFRHLLKAIEKHVDRQRFLDALSDIITVVRGPKPQAALRECGLIATHRVPTPNTWRELLQTLDMKAPVANQHVGLQEYGVSNASLLAGLEARGAIVHTVRPYAWDFPVDRVPLEENVRAIAAGQRDVLMFTSAHQVVNMLRCAEDLSLATELRMGLKRTVIASIGPTTTQMLDESDLRVDLEPELPKMGHLVVDTAQRAGEIHTRRHTIQMMPIHDEEPMEYETQPWQQSLFMKACRGEPTERTPIWLMRQAGRYMQEYREVRAKQSFLELCKNPQLCSEVMCTAVEKLGVDAAIIFSDLLPILEPMGLDLEFVKGDGPVIHNPVRESSDIDRIKELEEPESLGFVYETVRQTRSDMPDDMPVIGFSGSPFTLASYAIEGGGSRTYTFTKQLMYSDLGAWDTIMSRLSRAIVVYLNHQIQAGASCVQLFDSWVGCLSPADYERYVLPYMKTIMEGITPGVPVINFGTGNPLLLPLMKGDHRTVVGVDWRVPLDRAWEMIGHDRPVQGNMEPAVLLGTPENIKQRAADVLAQADGRPGHIFNLGHGVFQQTPVENAIALVEIVKELSAR